MNGSSERMRAKSISSSDDGSGLLSEDWTVAGSSDGSSTLRSSVNYRPSLFDRTNRSIRQEELTINTLRFSKLGLYGRTKEIEFLKECLNRQRQEKRKQVLFISGFSGTGKSALAETLKAQVLKEKGLFLRGKFEQHLRDEPYHAIAMACRHLCGELLSLQFSESTKPLFQSITNKIVETLGDELSVLITIVPQLQEVLGESFMKECLQGKVREGSMGFEETKNRFNYAFRRFIRVVVSLIYPIIMVIDDLQWIDHASLELLDLLITDGEDSNLMVIGCFRTNEVDDIHPLMRAMDLWKQGQESCTYQIHDICIGDLSVSEVANLIMDLLSVDDCPRTLELAEICHHKTSGNVFFLLEFLSALHSSQLLQFSFNGLQWQWDIEEIRSRAKITENVVDLVKARMQKLSPSLISNLKLAACLGSAFDLSTLQLVWAAVRKEDDDDSISMDVLVEQGLLESIDKDKLRYRWVHDKVQESAFALLSDDDLRELKGRVGSILIDRLTAEELDASIFVAVTLLNYGSVPQNEYQRMQLAEFNLKAAQKAVEFSAFQNAATYAEKGISVLSEDHWETKPELSLGLYFIAAQAASLSGNIVRMDYLCNEIVQQEKLQILDKLCAYNLLIDSMAYRNQTLDAINLNLAVLKQCGCKFPKSAAVISVATVWGILKTKMTVSEETKESIAQLPFMEDRVKLEGMKLLDKLATHCYICNHPIMVPAIMRSLKWTNRYGICEFSPPAFATTGVVLSGVLFDLQGGASYAKQALLMMEKQNSKSNEARTLFVANYFSLAMSQPLHTVLKPLSRAYETGMQSGDTENACWGIWGCLSIAFQSGRSLENLEADHRIYFKQMQGELKRPTQARFIAICWQTILNLMNRTEDPTLLTGEAADEELLFEEVSRAGNASALGYYYGGKVMLYTLFGEYEKCAEIALLRGDKALETNTCAPWLVTDFYYRGVSFFAMARKTGKYKYSRQAKSCLRRIKTWAAKGCPNVTHLEKLLEGELAAFQGKKFIAKNHFEAASVLATRYGFIQDAAFANERLGEFLLEELEDVENAVYKVKEAIKLYEEWGAHAKADQVRQKHDGILNQPPSSISVHLFA